MERGTLLSKGEVMAYPDSVERTAFLIWFEHGRCCAGVVDQLRESEYYRQLAGIEADDDIPKVTTIKTWEREHFWELRALDAMREVLPQKLAGAGTYMAYRTHDAALKLGEMMDKPVLTASDKIRRDVCNDVLKIGGVADNVAQYARPVIKQAINARELTTIESIREAELAALRAINDVD